MLKIAVRKILENLKSSLPKVKAISRKKDTKTHINVLAH